MTGAVLATLIAPGVGGGGGVVTPSPAPVWSDISGALAGATQIATILGITAPISLSATKTGGGGLSYVLNGTFVSYTGAFTVHVGDSLGWTVFGAGAGTVTVLNQANTGATLATFTYALSNIYF